MGFSFPHRRRGHPRFKTPAIPIILLSLLACVVVLSGWYDDLSISSFLAVGFYT